MPQDASTTKTPQHISFTLMTAFGLPQVQSPVVAYPNFPQRVPLRQRPFLRDCTDPTLIDTKKNIQQSLRNTVQSFAEAGPRESLIDSFETQRNGIWQGSPRFSGSAFNDELEDHDLDTSSSVILVGFSLAQQKESSSSILVNKCGSAEDTFFEELVTLLRENLRERLGLQKSQLLNPLIHSIITSSTNVYLQDFKSPTVFELYNSILRSKGASELDADLSNICDDILDMYESITLDNFEDAVFDLATCPTSVNVERTTENPGIYRAFQDVWMLDKPNFKMFDVDEFIKGFEGPESHLYAHNTRRDEVMNAFGSSAIKMNILKFTYAYKNDTREADEMQGAGEPAAHDSHIRQHLSERMSHIPKDSHINRRQKPQKQLRFADDFSTWTI